MLVIRRKVTRHQTYTVFMLPGHHEEWPTSDYEHQEILRLYKQDRYYEGIANDFTDYRIGGAETLGLPASRAPRSEVDRRKA